MHRDESPELALTRVASPRGILPEGPVWSAESRRLSWVDIELGRLHIAAVDGGSRAEDEPRVRVLNVLELGDQLGCALPAEGGGWVCGLGRRLATVSPLGVVTESEPLLDESERFNDGHIDPQGRLVIGTLNSDGPDGRQLLLRLEHDGTLTTLRRGVGISNGIAWSPDGSTIFHADTAARTIVARDYGDTATDSAPGAQRPFVTVDGMPDGIAIDAEGCLWVTVFDQGRVDRYSPEGELLAGQSILVPDAHVSSIAFVGDRLDTLLITTGMPIMRQWLRRRRADDGYAFSAPAPVRGLPTRAWTPTPLPRNLPLR